MDVPTRASLVASPAVERSKSYPEVMSYTVNSHIQEPAQQISI